MAIQSGNQPILSCYLMEGVVVPAVANVPEPGFAPQTLEPVDQDEAVENPPGGRRAGIQAVCRYIGGLQ